MLKTAAVKYYKTEAGVARALGISRTAVNKWGRVVPWGSANELQLITGGELPVIPSLYAPLKSNGRIAAGRPA